MGTKKPENRTETTQSRLLKILLIAGSVLAALKVIFVDYTLDEEYQVVMAYRRLMGDDLFGAMWEPHQTSAFACVWLMRLFRAVTGGTTGVVLFLRVCTTVIQIVLAVWLYSVCCDYTRREYAFVLGLVYFNIPPKIIQIPEFCNLQLWFFTVVILSLMEYYGRKSDAEGGGRKNRLWLVLAGAGMAFEVLAYPSCLILFPFFVAVIFLQSRGKAGEGSGINTKRALGDGLLFCGVCGLSAVIWLGYVLMSVSPETFLRNVEYVLNFDLTHDVSLAAQSRTAALVRDTRTLAWLFIVIAALSLPAWILFCLKRRDKKTEKKWSLSVLAVLFVLAAEAVQVFYWVILRKGYEEPMIHLLVLLVAAVPMWRLADTGNTMLLTGLIGSVFAIVSVIYLSDLGIWYAIPQGLPGALFAVLLLIHALEKELGGKSERWIRILLVSLAVVSIFGKGVTLRAGTTDTNTILGVRGIIKEGPAAGILTNYMQAYITNSTYEEFEEYVEEGADCLIVTNMVGTAGTTPYMFKNCNICHFSIVDPTSYDERLLTYWSLYPEKQPEIIVVDCWYGQLMESGDSWIMQYIENDFDYSRVVDGKYVRYYFK